MATEEDGTVLIQRGRRHLFQNVREGSSIVVEGLKDGREGGIGKNEVREPV